MPLLQVHTLYLMAGMHLAACPGIDGTAKNRIHQSNEKGTPMSGVPRICIVNR